MTRTLWLAIAAAVIGGAAIAVHIIPADHEPTAPPAAVSGAASPDRSDPANAARDLSPMDPAATVPLPPLSPADSRACRTFAPLADQSHKGQLSYDGLRDGLRIVLDEARVDAKSSVAPAAAALLQEMTMGTGGDTVDLRGRLLAVVAACKEWNTRSTN